MPEILVDDHTLAYFTTGIGEPVIFLHGGGSSARQWKSLAAMIADQFRCYMPDFYGHGLSPPWPQSALPTLQDYAAIVEAVVQLEGQPYHLVGHSHGGAVAITHAVQSAIPLRSLTLIEPTLMHLLRIAGSADVWQEAEMLGTKHIKAVAEGKAAEIADEFLPYWIGQHAWQSMPAERRMMIIQTMPAVAQFWSSEFAENTPATAYAALDIPTLLIRGTLTRPTAHEIVDLLNDLIPGSQIVAIDGAGHMAPLTHANAVNAIITEHLTRHSNLGSD